MVVKWRTFQLTGELANMADLYNQTHIEICHARRETCNTRFKTSDVLMLRKGNGSIIEAVKDIGQACEGLRPSYKWKGYLEPNKRTTRGKELESLLRELDDHGPLQLFQKINAGPISSSDEIGNVTTFFPTLKRGEPGWIVSIPEEHAVYQPTEEMTELPNFASKDE